MGIMQHPAALPPAPAVMAILARYQREQLQAFVEIAIDLADAMDGDPDLENATDLEDDFIISSIGLGFTSGPGCAVADCNEIAYAEWTSLTPHQRKAIHCLSDPHDIEDAEEDDPPGQCDEDEINTDLSVLARDYGPGCKISDPDMAVDDDPCDEPHQDIEREQMPDDVPMLKVYSAEYNLFNDQRTYLGLSNLMSSFVGRDVLSADTGALHNGTMQNHRANPGVPI